LSQAAFHRLEDHLRSGEIEEQKRNRVRDAEAAAGVESREINDPYAPYPTPGAQTFEDSPFGAACNENSQSSPALPLVANALPFQRADLYDDDYEEQKLLRSDYDGRRRYTSHREDSISNFGTESYAPSRNTFQNTDKKGLLDKEALAGEIQEGETTEVIKETSGRRKWVALCWLLTFWVPTPLLTYLGQMKRPDIRQAWREKLALNMIIWFICACAVFVIAVLGYVICPTQHVTSPLCNRGSFFSPRFLMTLSAYHLSLITVGSHLYLWEFFEITV
jgi:chitin synthase